MTTTMPEIFYGLLGLVWLLIGITLGIWLGALRERGKRRS